jgi:hypothetical protein
MADQGKFVKLKFKTPSVGRILVKLELGSYLIQCWAWRKVETLTVEIDKSKLTVEIGLLFYELQ